MREEAPETEQRGLVVYVPRPESELRDEIVAGSGVVGPAAHTEEQLRIDFEGNLHDIPELARYADRVQRAAERHEWEGPAGERYATSACAYVQRGELIRVGRFDLLTRELALEDRPSLAEWLNVDRIPEAELTPSGAGE